MNETTPTPPASDRPGSEELTLTVKTGQWIGWLVAVCVAAEVLVVFLDYSVNYSGWATTGAVRRLVNITREDSVSSWLAVTQVTFVALTVWFCFLVIRARSGFTWRAGGWLVLALFFSYVSLDDGTKMHERLGSAFRAGAEDAAEQGAPTLGSHALEIFPSYPWQVVFIPFFAVMGLFLLWFLWRELRSRRARLLVAVAVGCFVFAVGLDFFEGLDKEHPWNLYEAIRERFPEVRMFTITRFRREPYEALRHFSKSIEEFVEMFGTTLLWAVFLGHLSEVARDVRIRFVDRRIP